MFIDASALCAILLAEDDAFDLSRRLARYDQRTTSAMALWETALAVSRARRQHPVDAFQAAAGFLAAQSIAVLPVPPEAGALAVDAYARFGKGRHRASLNFGDCFAYACARHYGVKLLYKGDDFALTDVEAA
jgi:ribonuclease VapC